jgi:hypothetical protein
MNLFKRLTRAPRRWAGVFIPSCKQVARLQSAGLDTRLPMPTRLGLKLHLLVCRWCRRYGRQVRFLRNAVRKKPLTLNEVSDNRLSPEARRRLNDALRKGFLTL